MWTKNRWNFSQLTFGGNEIMKNIMLKNLVRAMQEIGEMRCICGE